MNEPALAHLRISWFSCRLNSLSQLVHVVFPSVLVLEQVYIHDLNYLLDRSDMNFSEPSVLWNQVCRLSLNFDNIVLNFYRVIPCDTIVITTLISFRVSNELFKGWCLVYHHRFLAINHLSSHGVVKVGHLLKSYTFFVELLCVVANVLNWFAYFEAHFSEHSGVFDQGNKSIAVIYF